MTDPAAGSNEGHVYPGLGTVLVIIPTYNEKENVELIVGRVRAATPQVDILVVDDNSPDGTGDIADRLAAADDHVFVMHREGKGGLGRAYIAGFGWGLERGYEVLCEMDADGSHAPEQLHLLLDALPGADLVLGSRWVRGGSVVNWPKHREVLSRGGNTYVRLVLGMPLKDATGGYRAFRRRVLETLPLDEVESKGYSFQVDMSWRVVREGFRVREVPITFTERQFGASKMSGNIVREALTRVTVWGYQDRRDRTRAWVQRRKEARR